MSDTVQEIKNRLDIAEVLRGYIKLIPAGKNLKALCPFHKEKTPSFMVSPDRGSWHCFGCSEGGDMFKFVMKYENLEFFEAMKLLAEKAGVTVAAGAAGGGAYRELYDANRAAKDFFVAQLAAASPSAHQAAAGAYLNARGLTTETIREFEIGLAPAISDGLFRALTGARHAVPAIAHAGLIIKSERGTYWDRFRGRIMFPLYNNFGKVVGFTGRVLPSEIAETGFEAAKYVNSPETPIFNKGKTLYGFHKAKAAIRETKTAIVVEGQMDFLMMWQDGIKNVVASSGTALTKDHLDALRRVADTLILSFDADDAGLAAAERSIDLAQSADFNVKILTMRGDYKDPADVVLAAPGKMAEFVAAASLAMQYYFARYIRPTASPAEQKKQTRVVLGKIKQIASPIERLHWVRELGALSGITEKALTEEMEALKSPAEVVRKTAEAADGRPGEAISTEPKTRSVLVAERILSLVAAHPRLKGAAYAAAKDFSGEDMRLLDAMTEAGIGEVPLEIAERANLVALRAGLFAEMKTPPEVELMRLLRELRVESLKKQQSELHRRIVRSEQNEGDAPQALQKEFDAVTKELHTIQTS
ncbi:MAG: DNA primase [Candidatus Harrisonbacteria bacterium]|nr:DNA primase [Candidatus Harrisonbacteria bacterium]